MEIPASISLPALLTRNLFWPFSLVLLAAGIVVLFIAPGAEATFWANSHNTPFLDRFFNFCTHLAEWPVIVAAIFLAFYNGVRAGILSSLFYGSEALSVVLIKNMVNASRPRMEIGIQNMHTISGVVVNSYHSFPSGHTAAAFMGFGIISIFTNNRFVQGICAPIAALIGYSRMYLGQHYLRDVIVGECIALALLFLFVQALPKFETWHFKRK